MNARIGSPTIVNQLKIVQGIDNTYVTSALAEKVNVNATSARPIRSLVGHTAARPTSQVTYQAKNHGVTTNSTPNVASEASITVRMLGTRHSQMTETTSRQNKVA